MPDKATPSHLQEVMYLTALEQIRCEVVQFHKLEEDYGRLEVQLQNGEAVIRNKIASEQQVKLYEETLKTHIEELQLEKY